MMRVVKVVGLGEVLWDLYPDGKRLGGAPSNVAVHARRLGAEGITVSGVGLDDLGAEIVESLVQRQMTIDYIQRIPNHPTGTVVVELDKNGVPSFSCSKDAAFDHMAWNRDLEELAGKTDAVLVGTLAQRNEKSRQVIQRFLNKAEAVRMCDVNFRGWSDATGMVVHETMMSTDILKLNEAELHQLQRFFSQQEKEAAHFLVGLIEKYNLILIVLTMGEKGCFLTDGSRQIFSPGIRIDPVDTTGCGDAFAAGLIVKYLQNVPLDQMAEFANQLAAFNATKKGAVPEYTADEFDDFCNLYRGRNKTQALG